MKIGIIDSGIGGKEIEKEIQQMIPKADIIYFADTKNFPYGTKPIKILHRILAANIQKMIEKEAEIIVLACNSATVSSVNYLRKKFSVPIIGVEPAIKPASLETKNKTIALFSTPITSKSQATSKLIQKYCRNISVYKIPFKDLAQEIEENNLEKARKDIKITWQKYHDKNIDTIVLGCTHYTLIKQEIQKIVGQDIAIIDSNQAVTRQVKYVYNKLMKKKTVGLIYGGKSPEHQVSKMTAESIRENIDRDLFNAVDIYIDKNGKFNESLLKNIDVAFLAVHGENCEDGKLQKFLDNKKIKYTGSGALASRINMNKISEHEYFKNAGLNTTDYIEFSKNDNLKKVKEKILALGLPIVIKPNNGGSSIGISKVMDEDGILKAVKEAFKYDNTIIVEKAVNEPREIEVGILGNKDLIVSNPGEILTSGKFYSYKKKYFEPFATETKVSNLNKMLINNIKKAAEKAYRCTHCCGYARVDFFLDKEENIYLNEINTLPGFTKTSMFPKLMNEMGINYSDLITKIINLALEM